MGLKKGDIIDESKRHPDGCGLVLKVIAGGEGFEKVICCGHELTAEDVVASLGSSRGRKKGKLLAGMTIDEKKTYPDSCGLRVMIMDGGAGFQEIVCCGHSLTASAMEDLSFGQIRSTGSSPSTPEGNA